MVAQGEGLHCQSPPCQDGQEQPCGKTAWVPRLLPRGRAHPRTLGACKRVLERTSGCWECAG